MEKERDQGRPLSCGRKIIPSGGWVVLGTFLILSDLSDPSTARLGGCVVPLPVRYGHGWQVAAARSPPHQKRILIDGSHVEHREKSAEARTGPRDDCKGRHEEKMEHEMTECGTKGS